MMLKLIKNREPGYLYIKNSIPWQKFCLANEVRAGETFIFELTEKRELKFFSKVRMNFNQRLIAYFGHTTSILFFALILN